MATPEPLQLPLHGLSRLLDEGSALVIVPKPSGYRDSYWWRAPYCVGDRLEINTGDVCNYCGGSGCIETTEASHAPGCDEGECASECPIPIQAQEPCPCGGGAIVVPATVTAVDAKRVREISYADWRKSITDKREYDEVLVYAHNWWQVNGKGHPFDTAWAWVLGLSLERKDRK